MNELRNPPQLATNMLERRTFTEEEKQLAR
jgi:hypothetical protein